MVPGLAEISRVLSSIKIIADMARDGKTHEVVGQVINLQSAMLELQSKLTELIEENRDLREQLANKDWLDGISADLEMQKDGQFLIRKSERDAGQQIPYCPVCWGEKSEKRA
jgi:hypothetical protein